MSRVQLKWLLVSALWAAALVLFVHNWQSADLLRKYLADVQTINAYQGFFEGQRVAMGRIQADHATLRQPIESLDFGLLFLEEEFFRRAKDCDLKGFQFVAEARGGSSDRIPVNLKVQGSVKGLLRMVHELERDYPFLVINSVATAKDGSAFGTFVISLTYYFKLGTA